VYVLRPAGPADLAALVRLAPLLDSPNLPADADFLRARLERSERAFATPGPPSAEREYQFVLEETGGSVVGTCAILSKHGTPEMPHLFLRVGRERRRSESADVCVEHLTFQLGATEDGPSELGALVLDPAQRGQPGRPGRLLSWGRFAFIARQPAAFESTVLAEMRATFDEDGRNRFWRAFGRRFTDMSYDEADRRSVEDKSFITDLFPDTPFYAALLDKETEAELGQVHEETRPALRLLEQAGMKWIGEIDPFDAGPFYGAEIADLAPVRNTVQCRAGTSAPAEDAPSNLVTAGHGPSFRCVYTPVEITAGEANLSKDALRKLDARPGDDLWITPLTPAEE